MCGDLVGESVSDRSKLFAVLRSKQAEIRTNVVGDDLAQIDEWRNILDVELVRYLILHPDNGIHRARFAGIDQDTWQRLANLDVRLRSCGASELDDFDHGRHILRELLIDAGGVRFWEVSQMDRRRCALVHRS